MLNKSVFDFARQAQNIVLAKIWGTTNTRVPHSIRKKSEGGEVRFLLQVLWY